MSMSYEIAEESHRLLLERLFSTPGARTAEGSGRCRIAVYEARLKVREAKAVFDNETRRLAADVVAKDADLAAKELVAIAAFEKFAKETRDAENQELAVRMSQRVVCNNSFNPS